MRPAALLLSVVGCASAPRMWAHPDAATTPARAPLVAEPFVPDPVAPAADRAVASADGRSRTRPGPCAPEHDRAGDEDAVVACTFTPDRGWREWRYGEPGTLLDVYDGVALIARTSAAGDADVVRYDIDLGRATTLGLPEPTARWHRAGFTRSGMLAGVARLGTAEHPRTAWVHGPTDGGLDMEPLPFDADDLGVDGDLAVCVGVAGAAVTSTLGWSRAVSLPNGAPRAGRGGAGVRRVGERVQCAAGRCVIDGAARVTVRAPGGGNDPAGAVGR